MAPAYRSTSLQSLFARGWLRASIYTARRTKKTNITHSEAELYEPMVMDSSDIEATHSASESLLRGDASLQSSEKTRKNGGPLGCAPSQHAARPRPARSKLRQAHPRPCSSLKSPLWFIPIIKASRERKEADERVVVRSR